MRLSDVEGLPNDIDERRAHKQDVKQLREDVLIFHVYVRFPDVIVYRERRKN